MDLTKRFKEKGIKNTKQRRLVFEILNVSQTPLTAEQIYFEAKKTDQLMSLSTVYRVVDLFVEKEMIQKSSFSNEHKANYMIVNANHKHHLFCMSCKKMLPLKECPIHQLETALEKSTNYQIMGHKLELYGYCPNCKDIL